MAWSVEREAEIKRMHGQLFHWSLPARLHGLFDDYFTNRLNIGFDAIPILPLPSTFACDTSLTIGHYGTVLTGSDTVCLLNTVTESHQIPSPLSASCHHPLWEAANNGPHRLIRYIVELPWGHRYCPRFLKRTLYTTQALKLILPRRQTTATDVNS